MKKPSICIRGNEYPLNDVIESKSHKLFRNVRCFMLLQILSLIITRTGSTGFRKQKSCFVFIGTKPLVMHRSRCVPFDGLGYISMNCVVVLLI